MSNETNSNAASEPAEEPDLNEILAIADDESEDSMENGDRLFTREGVARFGRRMYDRGIASEPAARLVSGVHDFAGQPSAEESLAALIADQQARATPSPAANEVQR